ncbi:MAG: 2-succinyl-5-enolpyruvyl-6-hydroxy-3-cyclohexene-1-carboxylic-acid synthase [Acidimicrobiia bacterium]
MTNGAGPGDLQATFCATVVDEWVRAGVRLAMVAPGSRSTPMLLALAAAPAVGVHVFHDERAAAFAALGAGLASGQPAVALCSSGTAAAHFHAAVIEADLAAVPLLVCTADRPPESRHVGAPQTIDQAGLYGRAPRWAVDAPVATEADRRSWRSLASRAVLEAAGGLGGRPGPVHLNLPFREPLVGEPGDLPAGRSAGRPWHRRTEASAAPDGDALAAVAARLAGRRGLVVAGGPLAAPARAVADIADRLGYPLLAGPRAGVESVPARWDALLRAPVFVAAHRPEVVLRFGPAPASRALSEFLAGAGAEEIVVGPAWCDPDRAAALFVPAGLAATALGLLAGRAFEPAPAGWRQGWDAAGAAAERAVTTVLDGRPEVTEPGVARAVIDVVAETGAELVVASSMPVRDVEWYAGAPAAGRVHANRGANGIDGTVASAVGVALATRRPTVALLGDIAFLHDSTVLVAIAARPIDLTLVVVDNDGGGIFSFLPQASRLAPDRFETYFGTPHGVAIDQLAAVHGLLTIVVEDPGALLPALRSSVALGGVRVVLARTDRAANVALHHDLHRAVAGAVDELS